MDPTRRFRLSMLAFGVCVTLYGAARVVAGGWGIGAVLLLVGGTGMTASAAIGSNDRPGSPRDSWIATGGAALFLIGTVLLLI